MDNRREILHTGKLALSPKCPNSKAHYALESGISIRLLSGPPPKLTSPSGDCSRREPRCGLMGDKSNEDDELLPGLEALDDDPPPEVVEGPSGKVYGDTSFGLRISDEPRKPSIRLIEHPYFDASILLTILCNCVTMAWESPLDPPGTTKAGLIDFCEWFVSCSRHCSYSFKQSYSLRC